MEEWTVQAWVVLIVAAALCLLVIGLLAVTLRARAHTRRELSTAHAETTSLRAQVDEIERRLATPKLSGHDQTEYVITHLGEEMVPRRQPAPTVEAPLFADLVLRETVVQAASLAHGLRRALSAESRNRIRFEMRREVRASRKRRRRELKEFALRARAEQRAGLKAEDAA